MKTLKTRILLGYVIIIVVLAAGGVVTARIQHDHLYGAVDQRIQRIVDSPRFIEKRLAPNRVGKPAGAGLSDTYLGIVDSESTVSTIASPDDDSDFLPDISALSAESGIRTVRSVSGNATSARASLVVVDTDTVAVVAIPLTNTERAISRLNTTLLLVGLGILLAVSLLTLWILLLGIKPLRELTVAASKVSAGQSPDVSAVPTASREAADLKGAINSLIQTAKDNDDKMRRFVADASHELRTPLTTLRGYTSLLTSESHHEREFINDSLTRMNEEALRMSRLVDDLLTLTKADSGSMIESSHFDITRLINDIASDLRVVQPQRTINVKYDGSMYVTADRSLIAQCVLALASNALRHTPVSADVTIAISSHESSWRVDVMDKGPGIADDHLPLLFDRFYRVAATGSQAGSGLGLAIVASIVERHNGHAGVTSAVGAGSSFWFEIPLTPVDAADSGGAVG